MSGNLFFQAPWDSLGNLKALPQSCSPGCGGWRSARFEEADATATSAVIEAGVALRPWAEMLATRKMTVSLDPLAKCWYCNRRHGFKPEGGIDS